MNESLALSWTPMGLEAIGLDRELRHLHLTSRAALALAPTRTVDVPLFRPSKALMRRITGGW
jgi:hypothetical protein